MRVYFDPEPSPKGLDHVPNARLDLEGLWEEWAWVHQTLPKMKTLNPSSEEGLGRRSNCPLDAHSGLLSFTLFSARQPRGPRAHAQIEQQRGLFPTGIPMHDRPA